MKRTEVLLSLVALLLIFVPKGANSVPQGQSSSESIPRSVRIVFNVVHEDGQVSTYDNFSRSNSVRDGRFPEAIFQDPPTDHHRFILFRDVKWLRDLSGSLRTILLSRFNSGKWIIGIRGSDPDLKDALGLLPPELAGTMPPSTMLSEKAVFLYRNPTGLLNQLVIDDPGDRNFRQRGPNALNTLSAAFDSLRDWYSRRSTALADTDSPWTSITYLEWSTGSSGSFQNSEESIGTIKFTMTVYWLDSDQQGKDWYRVDFQTFSEITNYEYTGHSFGDTSGKCGWWTPSVEVDAQVTTPGGEWYDYMPSTTVGSTSTGFTIGGDLSTSGTGISGAYSQSYGTSDVTIQVLANSQNQGIQWVSSLTGCGDYSAYPYYSGASSAARTTYNLNPSLIADVPAGVNLQLQAQTPLGAWGINLQKDYVKCDNICLSFTVDHYYSSYGIPVLISCTKSACTWHF